MFNFLKPLRLTNALKTVLVTKIAVNIEINIPQKRTVAKPRIGPVPNCHSTKAAINVVMFASTMVVSARLYPPSIAAFAASHETDRASKASRAPGSGS